MNKIKQLIIAALIVILTTYTPATICAAREPFLIEDKRKKKKGACQSLRKCLRATYFCLFPEKFDDEKLATFFDETFLNGEEKEIAHHESSNIVYATSSLQGNARPRMEDTYFPQANGSPRVGNFDFFAVYDGHGGDKAVKHVSQRLHNFILKEVADPYVTLPQDIRLGFVNLNNDLLADQQSRMLDNSGTTATIALIQNETLYVANVGDSPAIISQRGVAQVLSKEHKANDPQETKAIEKRGGSVSEQEEPAAQVPLCTGFRDDESPIIIQRDVKIFRVDGNLAMSRAFGNNSIANHICAIPHVKETLIDSNTEFLILVSDGISDVMTPQAIVDFVSHALKKMRISRNDVSPYHAKKITDALVDFALKIYDHDNVTAQIIFFKTNFDGEAEELITF